MINRNDKRKIWNLIKLIGKKFKYCHYYIDDGIILTTSSKNWKFADARQACKYAKHRYINTSKVINRIGLDTLQFKLEEIILEKM
jgi:hypothetical protein